MIYVPMIKHNATKVSAYALYSVWKFSFRKFYTEFVGNLLHRVSHKITPCAVLLERFKNFQTLIRMRRTLGEHFVLNTNLGEIK